MTIGKVLSLDDNPDSAELIARVARSCGYDARTASDGDAFVKQLREWRPNVITLDLCMPQEDGIAIVSILAEEGYAGNIIIVSGQDDWLRKSASRLALAQGLKVVADMRKPVDLSELRALLSEIAKNQTVAE